MIVFYNPQVDDFLANPPHFKLLKRRPLKKYGFFLDKTLIDNQLLSVVVDGNISCFIPDIYFRFLPKYLRLLVARAEFSLWLKINGISNPVKFIDVNNDDVSTKSLLLFSYKGAVGISGRSLSILNNFKAVVVHLSHYFVSTKEKSKNLSALNNVWLSGDSDIKDNPYFKEFFPWYDKEFVVQPFCVAPRFSNSTDFDGRNNICIAAGSFHNLDDEIPAYKYSDFIGFFKTNTYHPIRKIIFDNKGSCSLIKSIVSPYRSNAKKGIIKKFIDHFMISQKAYFKIDLVKEYNEHKFAVIGEELSGFPALGAFEAMACGAILIGLSESYKGMGFNFQDCCVEHDNSINSILNAMDEINSLDDKGRSLSVLSSQAMSEHFTEDAVYKKWVNSFTKVNV